METRFTHHEDAIIVQLCAEAAEFATMARDWDRWVNAVKPTAKRAFQRYISEDEGWGGIWGSLPRLIEDLYITDREPWCVRPQTGEARIAIQYHNACFPSMLSDRDYVVAEMERQYPTLGETTVGRPKTMGSNPAGVMTTYLNTILCWWSMVFKYIILYIYIYVAGRNVYNINIYGKEISIYCNKVCY